MDTLRCCCCPRMMAASTGTVVMGDTEDAEVWRIVELLMDERPTPLDERPIPEGCGRACCESDTPCVMAHNSAGDNDFGCATDTLVAAGVSKLDFPRRTVCLPPCGVVGPSDGRNFLAAKAMTANTTATMQRTPKALILEPPPPPPSSSVHVGALQPYCSQRLVSSSLLPLGRVGW